MRRTLVAAGVAALAACGGSSAQVSRPVEDAGDATPKPADAGIHEAHAEKDAPDASSVDADSADAAAETGVGALGPLSSCVTVATPPAPGCPSSHAAAFMCAVTEAATLSSLGCTVVDVVSSGEVLGCCPPCPETDAGACYQ